MSDAFPWGRPEKEHVQQIKGGLEGVANSLGVDVSDPAVQEFMDHVAFNIANDRKIQTWLSNMVHQQVGE